MSTKYPGGIITKNPATPTGPFETGTAPGIWTLTQQAGYKQQGVWPTAGLTANYIEDVFSTYLYTGNGSTQTITNGIDLAGKGGLVWQKTRSIGTTNHVLCDTARGVNAFLFSNDTLPSINNGGTDAVYSYNANGFSTGTVNSGDINLSGKTAVSWTFRKQPKFFDVVTYTGTGSNTTIAHSLGSVPGSIIVKRTDTTAAWAVYHRSLANTQYLVLNTTAAAATGATRWNSTTPTSSVFSLGTDATVNASAGTYVAYLFAHDAGGFGLTGTDNVISCGTFTCDSGGNATVNLGYEPQFVIMKSTSGVQDWVTLDVARGWSQTSGNYLRPNLSNSENANPGLGFPTATGFTEEGLGGSGSTYIYIAIRRGPMKVPTTGTSVYQGNTYTGNATANTTVAGNFGFPVDLMLLSNRSANATNWSTYGHYMIDRLRGQEKTLGTANTGVEVAGWQTYNAFDVQNSIGWGLYGTSSNTGYMNNSGGTWVANGFRRAPSFFDEVCYTGNGTGGRTVAHNLTVAPEMIIIKSRSNSTQWAVYQANIGNTKSLALNYDDPAGTNPYAWNNTSPTSTVFTVGDNASTNATNYTYVAYLFATCAGVSKVGSYTGTGALQTVNCGFTSGARFVLIKRTDSTGDWWTYDSARGISSGNDPYLFLNSTAAEVTSTNYVDTDSTGFKVTAAAPAGLNANGGTYIFLAVS